MQAYILQIYRYVQNFKISESFRLLLLVWIFN